MSDQTDLIDRLRNPSYTDYDLDGGSGGIWELDDETLLDEAADEIERLRAEVEGLRHGLARIIDAWDGDSESMHDDPVVIARAALAGDAQ